MSRYLRYDSDSDDKYGDPIVMVKTQSNNPYRGRHYSTSDRQHSPQRVYVEAGGLLAIPESSSRRHRSASMGGNLQPAIVNVIQGRNDGGSRSPSPRRSRSHERRRRPSRSHRSSSTDTEEEVIKIRHHGHHHSARPDRSPSPLPFPPYAIQPAHIPHPPPPPQWREPELNYDTRRKIDKLKLYEQEEAERMQKEKVKKEIELEKARAHAAKWREHEQEEAEHIKKEKVKKEIELEKARAHTAKWHEHDFDYETRKKIDKLKLYEEEEAERKHKEKIKKEIEIEKARALLEKEEKEKKEKELRKKYIADWQREEQEKKEKAKKEKEAEDKRFEERVRSQFGAAGYSQEHIDNILHRQREKKDKDSMTQQLTRMDLNRPTFIRVKREHLHPDTLIAYDLPWEWDPDDPNYIIIKQWISLEHQDVLFEHTRKLHKRKLLIAAPSNPTEVITTLKVNDGRKDKLYVMRKKDKSPNRRSFIFT